MKKSKRNKKDGAPAALPPNVPTGAIERDRYEEKLPCIVDANAKNNAAAQLAACVRALAALKVERREAMAGFKKKMNGIEDRQAEYASTVENGTEMRNVDCVDYLLANNEVMTVRTDTGEVLDSRTATPEELQEPLAWVNGGGDEEDEESPESDDDVLTHADLAGPQHGVRDARPGDGH